MTERIYGLRELTRILTLTPRRAAQLKRLNLLHGQLRYTFRELLALRAAASLLDSGASVRQIRQALDALRRRDPGIRQPLAEMRLVLEGGRVLVESERVRFDPRTGQTVLDLDAGNLEKAAEATLVTGLVRPMAPPSEQAETWFERASEWDADAHFNLAGALARAGRGDEAVRHWQRYLELDAGSPWAKIARAHLEIVDQTDTSPE